MKEYLNLTYGNQKLHKKHEQELLQKLEIEINKLIDENKSLIEDYLKNESTAINDIKSCFLLYNRGEIDILEFGFKYKNEMTEDLKFLIEKTMKDCYFSIQDKYNLEK